MKLWVFPCDKKAKGAMLWYHSIASLLKPGWTP
jgi:hypothetical protein